MLIFLTTLAAVVCFGLGAIVPRRDDGKPLGWRWSVKMWAAVNLTVWLMAATSLLSFTSLKGWGFFGLFVLLPYGIEWLMRSNAKDQAAPRKPKRSWEDTLR